MKITPAVLALLFLPAIAEAQSPGQSAPLPPPATTAPPPEPAAPGAVEPAEWTLPPVEPSVTDGARGKRPEPSPQVGVELAVLPSGTFKIDSGGETRDIEAATAYGVGVAVRFPLGRYAAVDIAPRWLMNVTFSDEADVGTAIEIDFRARLIAGFWPLPNVMLYGSVAPGYSVILLPELPELDEEIATPKGPVLGLGAGIIYAMNQRFSLTTEIGYQFGFQQTEIDYMPLDSTSNYLHVSVGVLASIF